MSDYLLKFDFFFADVVQISLASVLTEYILSDFFFFKCSYYSYTIL